MALLSPACLSLLFSFPKVVNHLGFQSVQYISKSNSTLIFENNDESMLSHWPNINPEEGGHIVPPMSKLLRGLFPPIFFIPPTKYICNEGSYSLGAL